MATIFRGPIVTKPGIRRSTAASSQDGVTADRLQNLLAGKDTFFAGPGIGPDYDWPNPRGKRFPSDLRGFLNPAEVHLIGKDKFFGAAGEAPRYDYPNPRGKPFSIELRTFVLPLNLLLLSKDKFFSTAGMGPDYDYPNPTLRKSRFSAMTSQPQCNLLETTLAGSLTGTPILRSGLLCSPLIIGGGIVA